MTQTVKLNSFLKLVPSYRDYVWGGDRLRPGHNPTAEAWVVWEDDQIESGTLAGKTLGEAAIEFRDALLGAKAMSHTGIRFPLLIKLLDCAQWLSLQVHPNDEQAVALEGESQFGKTEAWHILEAQPNATLIAGLKPNTSAEMLADSIRDGTIIEHVQNWTYRVYDWGRPQTDARPLHIEKSIEVTKAEFAAPLIPLPECEDGAPERLIECEYFTLEMLCASKDMIHLDTKGESFHAITVIDGQAILRAGNESLELDTFQTAVIPASTGSYQFQPLAACRALKSSL